VYFNINKIKRSNFNILFINYLRRERRYEIIIPDTVKEKPQEGKVVAVGPGRRDRDGNRIAMEVKKGDRLMFGKYAGTEIKIDGVDHVIMKEDEIFCIIG
jgi:chaperonin GroES